MDLSLIIQVSDLLANDDGDGIRLTSVVSPTRLGASAVLNADAVTYTVSEAIIATANGAQDQFSYTITDAHGQTSTANVNIDLPDPVYGGIDFIPLALGDATNTSVQASTLMLFVEPGAEFLSVQDGVNVDVAYTDFGGTAPMAVAYMREHHDQKAQASFTMTYRYQGRLNTVLFKTVAADGSIPIGGGGETPPTGEVSVREPNGGYKNRLGSRPLYRNDFVYTIFPTNTRFMMLRYDVEETLPVNFQSGATTFFRNLVEGMQGSGLTFFYRDDDTLGLLGPITGGDYDIVYRLPGTAEWYHADPLFNDLGENPRLSRDPSPNPPMDETFGDEEPGTPTDFGYDRRTGQKAYNNNALVSADFPAGTRFVVMRFDTGNLTTDTKVNFAIDANTRVYDLLVALDAADNVDVTAFDLGGFFLPVLQSTNGGFYDIVYRNPGETKWHHADQLFEYVSEGRDARNPEGNFPVDPRQ
jgi:hypothetical protein